MAKKSKTQRAKASAARQQRKATREEIGDQPVAEVVEAEEKPKKSLFKKSDAADSDDEAAKKPAKKADEKPAKKRFQFLRDVKAEMKRVTWPTRVDVLRWSGVVIVALLFFGIFVAVLDNLIITPVLVGISGL
ncbi:preprotein translocase subunit SecE [Parvibacter caecicola]|uniref:Protein translocase subunit SecE n=1 Tax=Parvibacter caecicola TaxID=747645 RepID=A0A3N0A915_9ACTN|nr:preprotein translocase subunit SecE [Parvibacter caecicola]MBB3170238.1 preprotein translocase subunit SecE [Parvibacter caecicola]MCR2041794.1 preprotein translocase subunit SecE [Parvibacter caecicola]RNL10456.1 preprotein translocase subunit SecE [Parvibacter caecicola]TJW12508.1 preprotein translocase subunit SecE [Parvibacter caecicola]